MSNLVLERFVIAVMALTMMRCSEPLSELNSALNPNVSSDQDSVVLTYYADGELESEVNYVNGVREGLMTYYFQNGQIKQKLNWKNGLANGVSGKYYENGRLHVKLQMLDGTTVGERYVYYDTGELMLYAVHNSFGKSCYSREYDKNGKIISLEGDPIVQVIFHAPDLTIALDDTLKVDLYIANPPEARYTLWVGEIDSTGHWIDSSSFQKLSVDSSYLACEQIFRTKGLHYWSYLLDVSDSLTMQDTTFYYPESASKKVENVNNPV